MKKTLILLAALLLGLLSLAIPESLSAVAGQNTKGSLPADQASILGRIEELTNAKGEFIEKEGVYKVGFPRSDLKVNISGVTVTPPLGLGVWASFKIVGDMAMVMGDTVMTEDQVNPVLSEALDNGLEVTAIHNHFFWDSPKIMFMHIGGHDEITKLATSVGRVFAKIKQTAGGKGDKPHAEIDPAQTTLDPKKIEVALGLKGMMSGGVYKVTVGRTTTMQGVEVGNAMGVNTWAAFAGSDDKAVVDGDFVMLESEVQAVLKALRSAGINVVALHNHMIGDSPRMMFLHFWGIGSTLQLAQSLKAALDTQKK